MKNRQMKISNLLILWLGSFCVQVSGQSLPDLPKNVAQAYADDTRHKSGQPGANYWQNQSTYDIQVKFDPISRQLNGKVDIVYVNNSPDRQEALQLKLYPNLFKAGTPKEVVIDPEDIGSGVTIEAIEVNGAYYNINSLEVRGVNANMPIDPLSTGDRIQLTITYAYQLSKNSPAGRTGQIDESTFFIAYFFPRIATYDDIDGWDSSSFQGSTEVYDDFADFKLSVTVPNRFVVWATGDLINSHEVFTKKIATRLAQASTTDQTVDVIRAEDIARHKVTIDRPFNCFIFEAKQVTDVAFGISDHYIWEASSLLVDSATARRTRVDAVYHPEEKDFEEVLEMSKATIAAMSFSYPKWPFPYSHETVFQGLSEMEFPMMVNDHPSSDKAYTAQLTIHEIFHTMFPFYMGINQMKYAWMDEGWATIGEWLLYAEMYPGEVDAWGIDEYEEAAGHETDVPVMTLTASLPGNNAHVNSYFKPALGYLYAQDLLGDEKFYRGLHTYIRNWNGKHPTPWDFFNSMNTGSGVNLDWFWKAWFFDRGVPDLAIAAVNFSGGETIVLVEAKGTKPVPIHLTADYSDGSVEEIHYDCSVWRSGDREVRIPLAKKKQVVKLTLAGTHIPDVSPEDNTWVRKNSD